MADFNKVLLLGRLTRDPELRFTQQGTAVCDLSVAVNRVSRAPDGTQRQEACFVDVTVWGRQAETSAQYLKKGRQLFLEGHLTLERWETADGKRRSKLKVTAERIQFLGGPRGGDESSGGEPTEPGAAPDAPADADMPF